MEALSERLNTPLEGFVVSLVGICITTSEDLRFLKLIRHSPKGLNISPIGITSNKSCLRGATHARLQRLDFTLARGLNGGLS